MSLFLIALGGLFLLFGVLSIVIRAFGEGMLWGLATIFVPFAFLAFVVLHFGDTRKPLLAMVVGLALVFAAPTTAPTDDAAAGVPEVEATTGQAH